MSLSEKDKQDMLKDSLSPERRAAFRACRASQPKTFDDYIMMLDELQQLRPAPPRPPFVTYKLIKL